MGLLDRWFLDGSVVDSIQRIAPPYLYLPPTRFCGGLFAAA